MNKQFLSEGIEVALYALGFSVCLGIAFVAALYKNLPILIVFALLEGFFLWRFMDEAYGCIPNAELDEAIDVWMEDKDAFQKCLNEMDKSTRDYLLKYMAKHKKWDF